MTHHHHSAVEQATTRFLQPLRSWAKEEILYCLAAASHQNLPRGAEHISNTVCLAFLAYASHAMEQVQHHGDEAYDPETSAVES